MTDANTNPAQPAPGDDPLARLHKMSKTAGLGSGEYVAVNGMSVIALIMGVASSLSLLDPVLLVIPVVALALAIASIVQIKHSNGTQTGKGLAALGLLLAIGFCALVGGRAVAQAASNREDEKTINDIITRLDQDLRGKQFDHAYNTYFAEKFTSRFNPQRFTDTWKPVVEGNKDSSGMTGMKSNGRMEFDTNPDTGQKIAYAMAIMDFGPNSARIAMVFIKGPDGSWKISDIPDMFKVQQAPARPRG